MKRGYIWTAITQHIKPGVEGGGWGRGDRDAGRPRPLCFMLTIRGQAPPTRDKSGREAVALQFVLDPRQQPVQAARRERNKELLLLSRLRRPSVTCDRLRSIFPCNVIQFICLLLISIPDST